MAELFASLAPTPLAERLRPKRIEDVLGQDHLLGPDGPLGRMLAARKLASLILWGPPGCGKTTIARLLAEAVDLHFEPLSAVVAGVADMRRVFEAALGKTLPVDEQGKQALFAMADGDGRYLITLAEQLAQLKEKGPLPPERLAALLQKRAPLYDKAQEAHYNLISALHKSLRGSDVDAALYYFARMLDGGEDPKYIARRLVRFAVEDIGMADPNALTQTLAAWDTYDRLGSPEGELAIAQAVIYLGTAPKSNAGYVAFGAAKRSAKEHGSLTPPAHILNAPTKLMKQLGYGSGYQYDHNAEDGFSGQNYFPDGMAREEFYQPVERGFEREILKRLEYWKKMREKRRRDR